MRLAIFLLVLVLAIPLRSAAQEQGVFELWLNGEPQGLEPVAVDGPDIFLPQEAVQRLRLRTHAAPVTMHEGVWFSSRSLAPAATCLMDRTASRIDISAGPDAFESSIIDLSRRKPAPARAASPFSAYLNYGARFENGDPEEGREFRLPHELVLNRGGLVLHAAGEARVPLQRGGGGYLRQFTTLSWDEVPSMVRFSAGDVLAAGGRLGGSALLGGLRIHREYTIDPGYLRYADYSVSGTVMQNSVVEVRRNDTTLVRREVGPGKFTLQNLEPVAGVEDVSVIIRDPFGNVRTVETSLYRSPRVLKKGGHDFSYAAGMLRENFGYGGGSYERGVTVSGRHAWGFTDFLTVGAAGEGRREVGNLELFADAAFPHVGFMSVSAAGSRGRTESGIRSGHAIGIEYENILHRTGWSYRLSGTRYSDDYLNLDRALSPAGDSLSAFLQGSVSYAARRFGAVTAGYVVAGYRETGWTRAVSTRYSRGLWDGLSMEVAVARRLGGTSAGWDAAASVYWFPTSGTVAGLSHRAASGAERETAISFHRTPRGETGIETDMSAAASSNRTRFDADARYRGTYGIVGGRVDTSDGETRLVLEGAGSVAFLNGRFFAGRPVQDSFAVVRVEGQPGVPVEANGRRAAVTDGSGSAFLPSLTGYADNRILADGVDLPLNLSIRSPERHVAPVYRSGVAIDYAMARLQGMRGKVVVAVDAEEKQVPQRGVLQLPGGIEVPVVSGGEFYLEGVRPGRYTAVAKLEAGACAAHLTVPETDAALVDLGEVTCWAISR